MLQRLTKFWWLLILRGLVSLGFAVFAFLFPQPAFEALVFVLGVFLLADGVLALWLGNRMRGHDADWWMVMLEGALGACLGLVALVNPELTVAGLVLVLSLWFLVTGVFEIATAIKLRKEIDNEWLLGLAGLVSVGLGVFMLLKPEAGAVSIIWWLGLYAAAFGVLMLGLGLRVWRARKQLAE